MVRKIELLAPARTAEIGIEAIRHGADAVYIGAQYSARSAAANSVEDIGRLCRYAHLFRAKVYVALNTILYDEEIPQAEQMARQLYEVGVDAFIVQDLAFLRMNLPPVPLHASTQMDITSAEKVRMLSEMGFSQVVLARELGIEEIKTISRQTPVALEAFCHGALCVSYSGRCYASEFCFHRSANRGNCAQFCRLSFDLVDNKGHILLKDKHLLSLRDMNRSRSLEEMMDAGISSFKIEGRLKNLSYVKNITAFYRRQIDAVIARRPQDFCRSSVGESSITFVPSPEKSFNRGFTEYFLHDKNELVHSLDTPKSIGEYIGRVVKSDGRILQVQTDKKMVAGDGLCFIDKAGNLQGLRVNRVEGEKIFPAKSISIPHQTPIFRNSDFAFEQTLKGNTASRKIGISILLEETPAGFLLRAEDSAGHVAQIEKPAEKQTAQTPQNENIRRQLSKWGNTHFRVERVEIKTKGERFIPSSLLSEWRRELVEKLMLSTVEKQEEHIQRKSLPRGGLPSKLDFTANVSNALSRNVYKEMGVEKIEPAYEIERGQGRVLMTCRHCIRRALGICLQQASASSKVRLPRTESPLFLRLPDGRTFPLRFDCKKCEMKVLSP